MNWIDLIIFVVFILLFGTFVFDSIRLRFLNRKIFSKLVQAELDKTAISDKLNKVILEHNAEKTDGFLRFVSDSREQAYKYIEEVHEALKVFEEEIGEIK